MYDVVGEFCDWGLFCFVFLYGFDNFKGSFNRFIWEYILDFGILIEYNICMLKLKFIIKVCVNVFMKRKGKNLCCYLFLFMLFLVVMLFCMMVLGFVI